MTGSQNGSVRQNPVDGMILGSVDHVMADVITSMVTYTRGGQD